MCCQSQRKHKYNYALSWYALPEEDMQSLLPLQSSLIYLGDFSLLLCSQVNTDISSRFLFSLITLWRNIKCFLLSLRKRCQDAKQSCGSCACSLRHPCCAALAQEVGKTPSGFPPGRADMHGGGIFSRIL